MTEVRVYWSCVVWAQIGRIQFEFIVLHSHLSKLKEKRRSCLTLHMYKMRSRLSHIHTNARWLHRGVVKPINNHIIAVVLVIYLYFCICDNIPSPSIHSVTCGYWIQCSVLLVPFIHYHDCIAQFVCTCIDATYQMITSIERWYNCTWHQRLPITHYASVLCHILYKHFFSCIDCIRLSDYCLRQFIYKAIYGRMSIRKDLNMTPRFNWFLNYFFLFIFANIHSS